MPNPPKPMPDPPAFMKGTTALAAQSELFDFALGKRPESTDVEAVKPGILRFMDSSPSLHSFSIYRNKGTSC